MPCICYVFCDHATIRAIVHEIFQLQKFRLLGTNLANLVIIIVHPPTALVQHVKLKTRDGLTVQPYGILVTNWNDSLAYLNSIHFEGVITLF